MKSNEISVSSSNKNMEGVLNEAEQAAKYMKLNFEQETKLRLVAEEMVSYVTEMIKKYEGSFYIEGDEKGCEISLEIDTDVNIELQEDLIDLSSAKKNMIGKGFRGKFQALLATYTISQNETMKISSMSTAGIEGINFDATGMYWSLAEFKKSNPEDKEVDGLERNILEKFANDIVVAIKPTHVKVTVKKVF